MKRCILIMVLATMFAPAAVFSQELERQEDPDFQMEMRGQLPAPPACTAGAISFAAMASERSCGSTELLIEAVVSSGLEPPNMPPSCVIAQPLVIRPRAPINNIRATIETDFILVSGMILHPRSRV